MVTLERKWLALTIRGRPRSNKDTGEEQGEKVLALFQVGPFNRLLPYVLIPSLGPWVKDGTMDDQNDPERKSIRSIDVTCEHSPLRNRGRSLNRVSQLHVGFSSKGARAGTAVRCAVSDADLTSW